MERVRLALEAEKLLLPEPAQADVLVVPATPEQAAYAGRVARLSAPAGERPTWTSPGAPVRQALAYANREGYRTGGHRGARDRRAQKACLRERWPGAR